MECQDAEKEPVGLEVVGPEAGVGTAGRMVPVEPRTLEACTVWQVGEPVMGAMAVGRTGTQTRSVAGAQVWCPWERPPGRCHPRP